MEQIQVTARFPQIAKENLDEFKRLAGDALQVTSGDAGVPQYDWFFSQDETTCVVRETYAGSEAVLAHVAMVGEALGTLIELGGGVEIEVFGSPSDALLEAISAMQPRVYTFFQGK